MGGPQRRELSRRQVLRRGALLAAALPAALAACAGERRRPRRAAGARPLPLHDDLLLRPGLPLERDAVLRIYEWRDYLDHGVVERFSRRHGVEVQVESFTSMPEAVARLDEPGADHDVFFPVIDALPGLVEARLLRPLQHAYLPHRANLWSFFTDDAGPFYDVGSRYTVPYTVYSTGIAWRRDLVETGVAPDAIANPYDAYWRAPARGAVGLYDDYREVIAMALLRRGEDPNEASASALQAAIGDLLDLSRAVEVEVSADGAYDELQTGEYAIQQAWSGDVLSAGRFGDAPAPTRSMGFTWPTGGVVGCDLTAVCARGRNPVLAHAFVDFLLEQDVALDNFAWNGYQPPVSLATPASFADPGFRWASAVPPNLRAALLAPDDLEAGRFLRPLPWSSDAAWRDGWRRFLSSIAA